MCGRFTIAKSKKDLDSFLAKHFNIDESNDFLLPRYNVSPSQKVIAVIYDGFKFRVGEMTWNYQNRSYTFINARSETIDQKQSFKESFYKRRCLMIADGFYEWDQQSKQPYRILKKDESFLLFAGVYHHQKIEGNRDFGGLILTTSANRLIEKHHHRMPVILDVENAKKYLMNDSDVHSLKQLLVPYDESLMTIYPVSKEVNKASIDQEKLIKKTTD